MWTKLLLLLVNLIPFSTDAQRARRLAELKAQLGALEAESEALHNQLVGMFVACWARMEMSLDYSNWIILNLPGGAALASQLPHSLGQKVDLFKDAHRTLSALSEFKYDGARLVARVNAMKEDRHNIIHGRGSDILNGRSHEYVRLHLRGGDIRHLEKIYSQWQLRDLVRRVNELQFDVAKHMGLLGRRFAAHGGPD